MGTRLLACCGRRISAPRRAPSKAETLSYLAVPVEPTGFGEKVHIQRVAQGLSRERLGEMLGVSASCVAGWEQGCHLPQPEYAVRVKDWMGSVK
jgi:DNA-binding transcriptional regulator YiaG